MTLRYLAERANLSYSFIASLEKGRYNPSRESICALAAAMDEDSDELLILAGFLPEESMGEAYNLSKNQEEPEEIQLEEILTKHVSFNGKQLSTSDKNALLAFMQTMINFKQ